MGLVVRSVENSKIKNWKHDMITEAHAYKVTSIGMNGQMQQELTDL